MIQVKNSNVDTYSSNLTSIMSINVFKRRLGNKIDLFFMVTLKLSGPGQRWYFVSVVPGSVGHVVCCTLHWWTVYRQPLLLVLRQFCGAVDKGQNGCHGEWQLVVVFGRRPSRSPTMSLRRTRASRRRLTWRWCGLKQLSRRGSGVFAGHEHFVNTKRWPYWHVHSRTECSLQ